MKDTAFTSRLRNVLRTVLSDLRSYYLFAALVLFSLVSARAARMGLAALLGHVGVLALLVGGGLLEHKRRGLARDLGQARAAAGALQAKVAELEAVVLNLRIQKETERLMPVVEEIQRRLLAEFPGCATSFAVAETNGYVSPDELVMTAKARDGAALPPAEYDKILAFARECAKPLHPDLAIHWA